MTIVDHALSQIPMRHLQLTIDNFRSIQIVGRPGGCLLSEFSVGRIPH